MYLWQLWWLLALNLLSHSARILQLHLALTWLIFSGIRASLMLHHTWAIRWDHASARPLRLIWHYIRGEDSLLCLLSFEFESGQRAQLVSPMPRCLILACTNFLISIMVHAHVHLILDGLLHRWAVWSSGVAPMDLDRVNRSQHTLLELGTLAHHLLLSILWRHDAGWARRIYEVARLNRIKFKISRSHVTILSNFRQLSAALSVLQFWHPGSLTCLLTATRALHSVQIVS